ncbi:tetratricopeptide repeat protein [Butyricimonas synergistica]|uniref:tetratricopeptide repeat protein n=1 Tax=Butyricimonas synergistica TaxID=544644 RepID=UPI00037A483C|nr:tetratricopeptide repeat protein [Butyricimonas synergistica]
MEENENKAIQVIGVTGNVDFQMSRWDAGSGLQNNIVLLKAGCSHEEFLKVLREIDSDEIMLVDLDRVALNSLAPLGQVYRKSCRKEHVYYVSVQKRKLWFGFMDMALWRGDRVITDSPVLIGQKSLFMKAYAGEDLDSNLLRAVSYSLQKAYMKFDRLETNITWKASVSNSNPAVNYLWRVPFRFLFSGRFFTTLFDAGNRARRDMVYRMLMLLFGVFVFFYMPYVSKDYGISGDEYVDHRHSGYVLDYFTKGDKAALSQPKTALHLYGNSMQVVAAVVANAIGADDVYAVRHVVCALVGALGVIVIGLMGLRFGGGLCGLLSMLLLFFSPRFFGHSMNNLKDIPFAEGYLVAIFYFVRLFDRYPVIKLRHVIGTVLGIALALGTRSGGLLLFPYLVMYGGLFYILWVGFKEFYNFLKYRKEVENILFLIVIVLFVGYFLSIVTWPFALARPFTNVVLSLKEFTNYNIGLRTIFEGQQMMSNMLPVHYAPKYLLIASPLVVVVGFFGYFIFMISRKKEFSLLSFFILFSLVFPVFWVIYKKSNLYGGIRHLLFVMPFMVLLAARFWTLLLTVAPKYLKLVAASVLIGLLFLPARHMAVNHPNDYVYFNESVGGLKGAYGDYETDYYYNSLKKGVDWFKANVDYKGRPVTIVTNHSANLQHYFRKDTNVKVIYSRYYDKYSKDWDYMIFGNVYINSFQLKNGLFPVKEGFLHSVDADGLPMCVIGKRTSKEDYEAIVLEQEKKYPEAIAKLEEYLKTHPWNEEMWMRLSKMYYAEHKNEDALRCAEESLKWQPQLMDALNIKALAALDLERYATAHQAVDAMLAQNDVASSSYYLKGLIYYTEGRDKEALDLVNKALRYNGRNDLALALGGDILKRNRNYAKAIEPYEKVVQAKRADEKVLLSLAECYCRVKNYGMLGQVTKLLNEQGRDKVTLRKIEIRAFLQQKKLAEAHDLLVQMKDVEEDSELMLLWALYELSEGRRGTALEYVKKAAELDPHDWEAAELQKMLSQGGDIRL